MPELTLDEADRCLFCGDILYDPPACCQAMIDHHSAYDDDRVPHRPDGTLDYLDDYQETLCPVCGKHQSWNPCVECDDGWVDDGDDDGVNFSPGEEVRPCPECHGTRGHWTCGHPHAERSDENAEAN